MTARAEYTADEWVLLLVAPQAAAMAVAFADGAGFFETVGEAVIAATVQARGKERYPDNELIAALIDNRERVDPSRLPQPQRAGEPDTGVMERLREFAVEGCRDAMALLAERSNAVEAGGYASWVMESAKAAATATRHRDGLFGAKGPTVDAQERAMLGEIAKALGIEVGALPEEPDGVQAPRPVVSPESADSGHTGAIPAPDTVPRAGDGTGPDIPSGPIDPS
ncbi:MAG: hypothetical protein Q7W30_03510 [Coriobacteriia bacterium]|nr:hypothetical protein [Coriobacteriia bacterium]